MKPTRIFWCPKFHKGNLLKDLSPENQNLSFAALFRSTPSSGIPPQIIYTTPVHGEAIHKRKGETLRLEWQVEGNTSHSNVWYKVSPTFAL